MHALSDASRSTLTRRGWSGAVARRVSDVASLLRRYRDEEAAFVISNAVVNVANFGFFIAVGRLFSSSSYGAITALLSIVTVANTPLNAIQAGVVHATVAVRQTLGARSPRHLVITFALVGVAAMLVPLSSHAAWRFEWLAMGIAGAGNSGTAVAALFAPRLATLTGMSRSANDWILDNILQPLTGRLFGIDDAVRVCAGSTTVSWMPSYWPARD